VILHLVGGATDNGEPLRGCRADQHLAEFDQKHGTGEELTLLALADGFKETIGRAAPEQRGEGDVGVKNDAHRRSGAGARPAPPGPR